MHRRPVSRADSGDSPPQICAPALVAICPTTALGPSRARHGTAQGRRIRSSGATKGEGCTGVCHCRIPRLDAAPVPSGT
eukprot:6440607-Prymnesium_polylepis.1